MNTINGQTLRKIAIKVDETTFIDCTLIECVLGYSGGSVVFERTTLRNCKYIFFGPARRTIHFAQEVGLLPYVPEEWGEYTMDEQSDA